MCVNERVHVSAWVRAYMCVCVCVGALGRGCVMARV